MTGQIVCVIDDSPQARLVATVAARLAKLLGVGLMLMRALSAVHPVAAGEARHPAVDEQGELEATDATARLLADIALETGVVPRDLRIEHGPAAERACAVADDIGAALLVIGARRKGLLRRAVLGSFVRDVLCGAPCPVVVVPPNAERSPRNGTTATPTRDVVCGVDFDEGQDHVAEAGAAFAEAFGARLLLTHCVDAFSSASMPLDAVSLVEDREAEALRDLRRIANRLIESGFPSAACRVCVRTGFAGEQLDVVARRLDADLVVVGRPRGGRVREVLLGSSILHMIGHATTPIVVVT